MAKNGFDPTKVPEVAPVFELLIRWSPSGQMQAVFPAIDPTITLGMLEMAKALLNEKRAKAQAASDTGLVIPASRVS